MRYKILRKQNSSRLCFVCGEQNDIGLKTKYYECENEAGEKVLLSISYPCEKHQSYPGRLHGGIAATILDEGIGRAFNLLQPDAWGVTMELTTRYRKPTPYDQPLYMESKITKTGSLVFDGEGKLFLADGTICAEGKGRYLRLPIDKIANDALTPEEWFYVDEDLPEYIEIKKED